MNLYNYKKFRNKIEKIRQIFKRACLLRKNPYNEEQEEMTADAGRKLSIYFQKSEF